MKFENYIKKEFHETVNHIVESKHETPFYSKIKYNLNYKSKTKPIYGTNYYDCILIYRTIKKRSMECYYILLIFQFIYLINQRL